MCLADYTTTRPQLSDAIPAADRLSELGSRLTSPGEAACCHTAAATLRHLHALVIGEEADRIEGKTRSLVLALLTGVRALAETELAHGNAHWRRVVLLIDDALEALER
jgi:hypothetical protein